MTKWLSASQMRMMSCCEQQWVFRYIHQMRQPPAIAMLKGTGVHIGAETNFTQKIDSHEDLPVPQIQEAAVNGFEESVETDGIILTPAELQIGKKKVLGAAVDEVARLSAGYGELIAPRYQPRTAEQTFEIPIAENWNITGRIDWIGSTPEDREEVVVDMKTGKSSPDPKTDMQFALYGLWYRREYGRFPVVRVEHLKPNKKVVNDTKETLLNESDVSPMLNRIQSFIKRAEALGSGITDPMPAPPGAWWCSASWCGYWHECPFIADRLKKVA